MTAHDAWQDGYTFYTMGGTEPESEAVVLFNEGFLRDSFVAGYNKCKEDRS